MRALDIEVIIQRLTERGIPVERVSKIHRFKDEKQSNKEERSKCISLYQPVV